MDVADELRYMKTRFKRGTGDFKYVKETDQTENKHKKTTNLKHLEIYTKTKAKIPKLHYYNPIGTFFLTQLI